MTPIVPKSQNRIDGPLRPHLFDWVMDSRPLRTLALVVVVLIYIGIVWAMRSVAL